MLQAAASLPTLSCKELQEMLPLEELQSLAADISSGIAYNFQRRDVLVYYFSQAQHERGPRLVKSNIIL